MSPEIEYFYQQTQWLYTVLWDNPFFFIDYWSFVHFWSGFCLLLVFSAMRLKHPWVYLLGILIAYEVLEVLFIWFALHVFRPETMRDQGTDIIIGTAGALFCHYSQALKRFTQPENNKGEFLIQASFISFTIAFLWVGFYQYHYNHSFLNAKGLNLLAYGLWSFGGVGYLLIHKSLSNRIFYRVKRYAYSYLIYLVGLFIVELIGYRLLIIKEMSFPDRALIMNLIHGNTVLHIYYLVFPVIIVLVFKGFHPIFFRAAEYLKYGEKGRSEYGVQVKSYRSTEGMD